MALFYMFIHDYQTHSYLGWCTLEEFKEIRARYPYLQISPILASAFAEGKDRMLHCSPKQIEQHPEIGELLKIYDDKERSQQQAAKQLNTLALSEIMKTMKARPQENEVVGKARKR